MTFSDMNYEEYLQKLQKISEADWVQNHLLLKNIPNFWTILEYGEEKQYGKRSAHEIRTSRMLRWLIDPNETHGLGNSFAHLLLGKINVPYPHSPAGNKAIKAYAEMQNIDVFYRDNDNQMMVAIELKQYAKEGKRKNKKSQLEIYEEVVDELIQDAETPMDAHYIYLTPNAEKPTRKKWVPLGYEVIIDIIDQLLNDQLAKSTDPYTPDTIKVITDFKHDLIRTVDYASKKNKSINSLLNDIEKKLTERLAHEIEHDSKTHYLPILHEMNQDKITELEEVILITNEYIHSQNHDPNLAVQLLIRKIYNYLSAEDKLDLDNLHDGQKGKRTLTALDNQIREKYQLTIGHIQVTQKSGQGLYFYDQAGQYKMYISGDTYGGFPNHGFQLFIEPSTKIHKRSAILKQDDFKVDPDLILEDKLMTKDDQTIDLVDFIEHYLLKGLAELQELAREALSK